MKTIELTLEISSSNDAFTDNPEKEIARILEDAAEKIRNNGDGVYSLLDINGNKIGGMYCDIEDNSISMEEFIEEHREELTEIIKNTCPNCEIDDDEIENWILNDEGLYNWAREAGVEV
jgi:hypothetical protein